MTLAESLVKKYGLHEYRTDVANVITDVIDKVYLDVDDELQCWGVTNRAANAIKKTILMAGNSPIENGGGK